MYNRKYEIWHDEHKGDNRTNEYWHGIFFMPLDKKKEIITFLKNIRLEHKYIDSRKLKFSGSLRKNNTKQAAIVKNHLDLFLHLLITRKDKAITQIFNYTQKQKFERKPTAFLELNGVFGCKFVLFYIPDNHHNFNKYPMNYASRVETTFRIGFKGGIHLLFSDRESIEVEKFYFDGDEHHKRNINIDRIVKGEFRDYCIINKNCMIDSRQLNDRDIDSKMIMCFVDIILGGLIAKIKNVEDKNQVLYPLNMIYERLQNNKIINNPNGRWYRSISVSKLEIVDEKIIFPNFFKNANQIKLC